MKKYEMILVVYDDEDAWPNSTKTRREITEAQYAELERYYGVDIWPRLRR